MIAAARNRQGVLGDLIATHDLKYGAEIGVGTGPTTNALLTLFPDLHWLAVDYWPSPLPLHYGGELTAEQQAERRAKYMRLVDKFGERLTLLEMPSLEAAAQVPDGFLDLVFIDADHSYEACLADIKAWSPKVRPGGFIAGHDYNEADFPGVVRAVRESFGVIREQPERYSAYTLHPDDVWLVGRLA